MLWGEKNYNFFFMKDRQKMGKAHIKFVLGNKPCKLYIHGNVFSVLFLKKI